jgi:hypothetical protein
LIGHFYTQLVMLMMQDPGEQSVAYDDLSDDKMAPNVLDMRKMAKYINLIGPAFIDKYYKSPAEGQPAQWTQEREVMDLEATDVVAGFPYIDEKLQYYLARHSQAPIGEPQRDVASFKARGESDDAYLQA